MSPTTTHINRHRAPSPHHVPAAVRPWKPRNNPLIHVETHPHPCIHTPTPTNSTLTNSSKNATTKKPQAQRHWPKADGALLGPRVPGLELRSSSFWFDAASGRQAGPNPRGATVGGRPSMCHPVLALPKH
jgi:hypothetical protein